jgi:hypothetical protein
VRRLRRTALFLLALTAVAVVAAGGNTFSAFSATTSNGSVSLSSAPDWTAPTVQDAVIANSSGGLGLKTGATYNVYANVTDAGNPASGVSVVTANVSAVTTTGGSTPLVPCVTACTVQGVTYGYKSALLTENTAAGTKTWTVTSVDVVGNSSGAQSFTVSVDNTVPTVPSAAIAHTTAGPGISHGATYRVYANASDAASGVNTVVANVNNITTGQTAVALTPCTCTVGTTSYAYRSAVLTANSTLSTTAKSYTVTATDQATNQATGSFSITPDNTAPTASNVQTANGGSTAGKAEAGDTITLTFSQQMDPFSILSNWDGSSTNVVVRLSNTGGNDTITFYESDDATQIDSLGSINIGTTGYVSANTSVHFDATMVQSGTTVTFTLGSPVSGAGNIDSNPLPARSTMSWDSSTIPTDLAGNAASGNTRNEGGSNDREF